MNIMFDSNSLFYWVWDRWVSENVIDEMMDLYDESRDEVFKKTKEWFNELYLQFSEYPNPFKIYCEPFPSLPKS